jgi:TonB family protein
VLGLSFGLSFVFVLFTGARAQTATDAAPPAVASTTTTDAAAPTAAPEADAIQRRVTRARSLAAVGKLAAAASELESLRASSSDNSVRDVSGILLMGIYVEMPDYVRAAALLDEAYRSRTAQTDSARTYYALAGQTVKSVRTHVERYRSFGINVADEELPQEARGDIEQLRTLLERVHEQARAMREEGSKVAPNAGADANALIEDAASVRLRLARNEDERARWRQEISEARQRLVAGETRITKISDGPVTQVASAGAVAGSFNSFAPAAASVPAEAKPKPQPKAAGEAAKTPAPAPAKVAAPSHAGDALKEAAKAGTPISVGALHTKVARKVDPTYPSLAKMARISGVVTVFVVVNENGEVETVSRADGPAQLQAAASDAVRRWKFKPTLVDGQPVRVSGYINFNFSL